jgi:hypothetical protein
MDNLVRARIEDAVREIAAGVQDGTAPLMSE